ncbi:hypothetical protein Y032_0087g2011 [Ancylostoma ceylanicum]|uniref:Uncharacterized protein n=1 Tax=Ancylostoma ceylanicum TaxID=53326 RepID=A0A016TPS1_9BILA|nr:hypothetical protein Y032_0087g2011 [Ancylostoma ceylanicum]
MWVGDGPPATIQGRPEDTTRPVLRTAAEYSKGVEEIVIISTAVCVIILALLIALLVMWWERKRRRERYEAYYGITTKQRLARRKRRRRRGKGLFAKKQKLILPPEFRKPKKKAHQSKSTSKDRGSSEEPKAYGEQVTQEEIPHGEVPLSKERTSKGSEEKGSKGSHELIWNTSEEVTQSDGMIVSINQLTQTIKDNQMSLVTAMDEEDPASKAREKQQSRSLIF